MATVMPDDSGRLLARAAQARQFATLERNWGRLVQPSLLAGPRPYPGCAWPGGGIRGCAARAAPGQRSADRVRLGASLGGDELPARQIKPEATPWATWGVL